MHVSLLHIAFQTINFLVLVFLLQRFFYKPILGVIAERKQKIAREQELAASEKQAAEKLKADLQNKLQAIEDDKQRVLQQALVQAESQAASLRREMEQKIDGERARQTALLQSERSDVEQKLKEQSVRLGLLIAERLLREGAVVSDPLVAVHRALGQIEALPSSEQGRVWTELRLHGADLTSVDALSVTQVAQVKAAIESACQHPVSLTTQTEPKLLWGVELRLGHLSFAFHLHAGLAKVQSELLTP